MELAIQHSNNAATNWMIRKIGGPKSVERILKRRHPGIFQDTRIVEYIQYGGRTYRNKASAHDYSRFLYADWIRSRGAVIRKVSGIVYRGIVKRNDSY